MVKVKRSQAAKLFQSIDQWVADSVISAEQADKLRCSVEVSKFDYRSLAKYSFWFAIACFVISAGSFVLSPVFEAIVKFFELFFKFIDPRLAAGAGLAAISGGFYWWGLKRRATSPLTTYKNEALLFLGVLLTAGSMGSFASFFQPADGSLLLLLASIVYAALGLFFPSTQVWTFSLISIASWFGCKTGYMSGWGAYFFGMNYPLRFVPFSICIIALAFFFKSIKEPGRYQQFFKPTYIVGLFYLFMSLWILSIWGNGEGTNLLWSMVFGMTALGSIFHGLKNDDGAACKFGVTFFAINLYTKYFEYFWNVSDKALFFLLLGLSFWVIGTRAEKLWLFLSGKSQSISVNN